MTNEEKEFIRTLTMAASRLKIAAQLSQDSSGIRMVWFDCVTNQIMICPTVSTRQEAMLEGCKVLQKHLTDDSHSRRGPGPNTEDS